jgi:hypothetical protein
MLLHVAVVLLLLLGATGSSLSPAAGLHCPAALAGAGYVPLFIDALIVYYSWSLAHKLCDQREVSDSAGTRSGIYGNAHTSACCS